ncbi:hypothetical protein M0P65_01080 [Candidatus Gracilibacteria bacterium]|nr:hypothetical protein [Candidatus Gracilibacteria bacterium]
MSKKITKIIVIYLTIYILSFGIFGFPSGPYITSEFELKNNTLNNISLELIYKNTSKKENITSNQKYFFTEKIALGENVEINTLENIKLDYGTNKTFHLTDLYRIIWLPTEGIQNINNIEVNSKISDKSWKLFFPVYIDIPKRSNYTVITVK